MTESDSDSLRKKEPSCVHEPLMDAYGRPVNYLRISLTQRCNHMCFFCHAEGETVTESEMKPLEIERLVRIAVTRGVTRVKLTGGEPLLRSDLLDIVARLSPLVDDLSLTTNGTLLLEMAEELKEAGLDRVNVSLHSLDQMTYEMVTGSKDLSIVKKGIKKAIEVGLTPVKINMTILRSYNESEIQSMTEFAASIGAVLQLIEVQDIPAEPVGNLQSYRFSLRELEEDLERTAIEITQRQFHGRWQYTIPTKYGVTKVEVVRPMHNSELCRTCTRLRVTSDGQLKPCLYRTDNLVHIKPYLSDCRNNNDLLHAYIRAIEQRAPYWQEGDESDRGN